MIMWSTIRLLSEGQGGALVMKGVYVRTRRGEMDAFYTDRYHVSDASAIEIDMGAQEVTVSFDGMSIIADEVEDRRGDLDCSTWFDNTEEE